MKTIFTKIVEREIPAHIIYEDDLVIAFLDISQATPGHTLVVPKKEYKNIYELDEKIANHLFGVVVKLAKAINTSLKPKGLNILNNNEAVAGQTVFHYHIHLIPRYDAEDVIFKLNDHSKQLDHDVLSKRADLIKSAL
ncbi:MAG TPA: HIT family protein [Acholeplasmataceae bacterium]|jgi:histidine triad (HIT) family protein|nr:HIT family protein [Acholeplasmataceae bacterium]